MRQKSKRSAACALKKAAPLVLTVLSAAGTVAAVIFGAKAAVKAQEVIKEKEKAKGEELDKIEAVKAALPIFIPTVLLTVGTVACVFGSNAINKKQQAAYISAYTMLDAAFKDYKTKVEELYGEGADAKVEQAVVEEKHSGKCVFYEVYRDEFFERSREDVIRAEYELNRNFALRGYAPLNEFYEFLGLSHIPEGDILGWAMDIGEIVYGYRWIDFSHVEEERGDGTKYYRIVFDFEPTPDFEDDPF